METMSNLPYDVEIEYIESSGAQYIDTGIYGTETTEYEIGLLFISSSGSSGLIAARDSSTTTNQSAFSLSTWIKSDGSVALNDRDYDSGWISGTNITNKKCKISVKERAMYLDDVKVAESSSSGTFTMSTTYGLLRPRVVSSWDTDSRRPLSARIYYCKIWNNDVLVRDYIPVRVGGTGYLYDSVSGNLFGNAGSGSFTLGEDIHTKADILIFRRMEMMGCGGMPDTYDHEVEYLQSDGNQYLELPVYPSEATDACEVTIRRTANTAQQRLFFSGAVFNVYANSNNRVGFSYNGDWKSATSTNRSLIGVQYHKIRVDYKSKRGYVDSLAFSSAFSGSSSNVGENYLKLFGEYGTNPTFQGLIYGIKFWRNNFLLYELVPVRKNSVGYFYDKVGRKLHENKGTGNFTVGYDKYKNLTDYTQIDYIQSNSTAFVNTGVSATGNTSMHIGFKFDSTSGTRYIFGTRLESSAGFFSAGIATGSSNNFVYYRNASSIIDTGVAYDTLYHDMELNPTSIVIDNNSTQISSISISSQFPILLFAQNSSNTNAISGSSNAMTGKIYYAKIYENGTLIRDFIPVLHPDNVYGFFERVENKFYASGNSTDFSGGND